MGTTDVLAEIREMDLGELGEVARVALSTIYNRLRDDKCILHLTERKEIRRNEG